jgi:hypothetical protein
MTCPAPLCPWRKGCKLGYLAVVYVYRSICYWEVFGHFPGAVFFSGGKLLKVNFPGDFVSRGDFASIHIRNSFSYFLFDSPILHVEMFQANFLWETFSGFGIVWGIFHWRNSLLGSFP